MPEAGPPPLSQGVLSGSGVCASQTFAVQEGAVVQSFPSSMQSPATLHSTQVPEPLQTASFGVTRVQSVPAESGDCGSQTLAVQVGAAVH